MARSTGVRKRHTGKCRSRARADGSCNCDGSWRAEVYSARDGCKIRKTFATEAEARQWRADAASAISRGGLRAPTPTTIREAAVELLAGMRDGTIRSRSGKPYKPSVVRSYDDALERHLLDDFGAVKLSELRSEHVQRKVDRLLAAGLSASSVRNALMPLRVVYRRACRPGGPVLPAANPTRGLELPARDGGRVRIASPEEAEKLIGLLPRLFDRTLWAVAFYAGLRVGEILALAWESVDLAAGVIHVTAAYDPGGDVFGEPKSAAGVRRVPLVAVLRDYLLAWKLETGRSEGLVFGDEDGRPFKADTARARALRAWAAVSDAQCAATSASTGERCRVTALRGLTYCGHHRAQEAAGAKPRKPAVEPIGFHEARHTFASLLIAAAVNAKALSVFMGHSSIQVTFDLYGHLMPGGEQEAAALLDAYLARANTRARLAQLDGRGPLVGQSAPDESGSQRLIAENTADAE